MDHVTFNLNISSGNQDVLDNTSAVLERAFQTIIDGIEVGDTAGTVRDGNGNSIGKWALN